MTKDDIQAEIERIEKTIIPRQEKDSLTGEDLKEGFVMRTSKDEKNFFFQTAKEAEDHREKNRSLFFKE